MIRDTAAVIADQHPGYDTYLDRLRGVPVDECHLCLLVVPVAKGDGFRHGL